MRACLPENLASRCCSDPLVGMLTPQMNSMGFLEIIKSVRVS